MGKFLEILILLFLLSTLSLKKGKAEVLCNWDDVSRTSCELEDSELILSFNSTVGPLQTLKCHNLVGFPKNFNKSETVEKLDFGRSPAGEGYFQKIGRLNRLFNLTDGVMLEAFEKFPSLRWVDFSACCIQKIEKGAFEGGDKLIDLTLRDNSIENLDLDIFVDVLNLQRLDLSDNPLWDFQDGAQFPKMKLKSLGMKNCRLSTVEPTLLDNLIDLTSLHLSNNQIVVIEPRFFANLKNLQILRLPGNQFAGFDENIVCDLKHLSTFTFENNPLFCNCDVVNLMDLLRERNIYFNPPDCSFKTPAYIQASNQSRSQKISKLCHVSERMSSNECREPSSEFKEGYCSLAKEGTTGSPTFFCVGFRNGLPRDLRSHLGKASRLLMDPYDTNNLKILKDGEFQKAGLSSVEDLDLRGCQIQIIEKGAFKGGKGIVKLELQWNLLTNLDAGAFSGLENLKELNLRDNPINSFKKGSKFPILPKLEIIDLESCELVTLEIGFFENLKGLRTLNLMHNRMKTVNSKVFRPLPHNYGCIRLESNPWNCNDYQFKRMVGFLRDHHIHFTGEGSKCGAPACKQTDFMCFVEGWGRAQGLDDLGCFGGDDEVDSRISKLAPGEDSSEIKTVYKSHNAVIIAALSAAVSLIFIVFFAFLVGKYLRRSLIKGLPEITAVEYVAPTSQNDEEEGKFQLDCQGHTETII